MDSSKNDYSHLIGIKLPTKKELKKAEEEKKDEEWAQFRAESIFNGKLIEANQKKRAARKKSGRKRKERSHSGNGYAYIYIKGKQVLEHRYLMTQHLGRDLLDHEAVYFKDGDRTNITIENLELGVKPGKRTVVICPHCDKDIFKTVEPDQD